MGRLGGGTAWLHRQFCGDSFWGGGSYRSLAPLLAATSRNRSR